jgi:hypothetical protein
VVAESIGATKRQKTDSTNRLMSRRKVFFIIRAIDG